MFFSEILGSIFLFSLIILKSAHETIIIPIQDLTDKVSWIKICPEKAASIGEIPSIDKVRLVPIDFNDFI